MGRLDKDWPAVGPDNKIKFANYKFSAEGRWRSC
jgi:hypothetical protein